MTSDPPSAPSHPSPIEPTPTNPPEPPDTEPGYVEDFGNPRPEDTVHLPESTPDYIVASVEAETGIAEYARRLGELRSARRELEAEEEGVRRKIIEHLEAVGESQVFTASGQVAATLRISVRTGINRAKLEAVYPEVFAEVVTATRIKSIWLP